MAHVEKRGPRKYRARYRGPDGRERSQTFSTRNKAQDYVISVEHSKKINSYVDPSHGRQTFDNYAGDWLAKQVFAESTRERVESNIRVHMRPVFGGRQMATIQPSDVQAWIKGLSAKKLKPNTVKVIYGQLTWIMNAAVVDRVIATTPCTPRKMKLPKAMTPQIVPLTAFEVRQLNAKAQDPLKALIMVGAGSRLRQGEYLGLTVDRIDFLRRTIRVDRQLVTLKVGPPEFGPPKTKASMRTVPVPQLIIDAIAEHLSRFPSDDLVFRNSRGERWTRRSFLLAFARAVKLAGLPKSVTSHDLRHFYASLLIRHGESVKTVQSRLGHANAMETLNTYGHLWHDADDRTREAVENAFSDNSRPPRGLAAK